VELRTSPLETRLTAMRYGKALLHPSDSVSQDVPSGRGTRTKQVSMRRSDIRPRTASVRLLLDQSTILGCVGLAVVVLAFFIVRDHGRHSDGTPVSVQTAWPS
jgi:hypothetical protein